MPIFDEAAAVEAPKEGSPEYLIMVCQQHMAWLTVYAEGMTQADWRDMQDRLVSQIGKLVADFAALAALKPLLGGWRTMESAPQDGKWIMGWAERDSAPYRISWGRNHDNRLAWCTTSGSFHDGYITHWMPLEPLPPSPDKGGE